MKQIEIIKSIKTKDHEMILQMPPSSNPPSAVIILWGWWGATQCQLQKYAQIYHELNCATVSGFVASHVILIKNETKLTTFARETVIHTTEMIRSIEAKTESSKIPIIIHALSNGGVFVLDRLDYLLSSTDTTDLDSDTIRFFKDRLTAEIFDSSPAFINDHQVAEAASASFNGKSVILQKLASTFIYMLFALIRLSEKYIQGKTTTFSEEFWERMTTRTVCDHQAFVYSSIDTITMPDKLDELIENRRRSLPVDIQVLKFDDTAHVQHLRKYPVEYTKFIVDFVEKVLKKKQ